MTTTLAQLLQPLTADELRARVISGLQASGFPTSDWPSTKQGGLENGTVDMAVGTLADLQSQKLADAIAGGFLDFAVGKWMTFLARRYYRNERVPATSTVQLVRLSCAATAGPYTINVGDLVVTGPTGNHYRNIDGGRLEAGGHLQLSFQAETPGASYDDPIDTLTTLVTSLPGVTATNPRVMTPTEAALVTSRGSRGRILPFALIDPPAGTFLADTFRLRIESDGKPGTALYSMSTDNGKTYSEPLLLQPAQQVPGGAVVLAVDDPTVSPSFKQNDVFFWAATPVLQQGADEESDARLAARCRARWLTLSDVPTPGTVALWAREAAAEVVRVKVASNPSGVGMVVYISGTAGPAAPLTVIAVQNYITARMDPTDGGASVLPVDVRAVAASGGAEAPRGALAAVQAAADRNWLAYLASINIGGTVRLSELQQAVMDAGATNFSGLSIGGTPNVVLAATEVPAPVAGTSLTSSLMWSSR